MPASILQAVATAVNGGGTPPSMTLTGVTAGSAIYVVYLNELSAGAGTGCTDTASGGSNTYTLLETLTITAGGNVLTTYVAVNVKAGTYTVTPTGTAYNFPQAVAIEVGGVTTTPLDGHASSTQNGPGSATNAITVGPPSPNNTNPCIVVSVCIGDKAGGSTDGNQSAGTGYTLYTTLQPWGGTGNPYGIESAISSGASSAATWTAGGAGGAPYVTTVILLDTGSSASAPPEDVPPNGPPPLIDVGTWRIFAVGEERPTPGAASEDASADAIRFDPVFALALSVGEDLAIAAATHALDEAFAWSPPFGPQPAWLDGPGEEFGGAHPSEDGGAALDATPATIPAAATIAEELAVATGLDEAGPATWLPVDQARSLDTIGEDVVPAAASYATDETGSAAWPVVVIAWPLGVVGEEIAPTPHGLDEWTAPAWSPDAPTWLGLAATAEDVVSSVVLTLVSEEPQAALALDAGAPIGPSAPTEDYPGAVYLDEPSPWIALAVDALRPLGLAPEENASRSALNEDGSLTMPPPAVVAPEIVLFPELWTFIPHGFDEWSPPAHGWSAYAPVVWYAYIVDEGAPGSVKGIRGAVGMTAALPQPQGATVGLPQPVGETVWLT